MTLVERSFGQPDRHMTSDQPDLNLVASLSSSDSAGDQPDLNQQTVTSADGPSSKSDLNSLTSTDGLDGQHDWVLENLPARIQDDLAQGRGEN
jgi:hypothetical protein